MIRIFIGYDKRESIAYHVLAHSILKYSTEPVAITPLCREQLPVGERDEKASTDFADTRFLVPWLCDYEGWAMFCDADQMFTSDPRKLWDLRDDNYTVMVRKHNYNPTEEYKFLEQKQYKYSMKNWSSLMLFNNEKCKSLTPAYVNCVSGLDLHQFKWTNEEEIGDLPRQYNYLVGHDRPERIPHHIHWTLGTPCFKKYQDAPFAKEWREMKAEMEYAQN